MRGSETSRWETAASHPSPLLQRRSLSGRTDKTFVSSRDRSLLESTVEGGTVAPVGEKSTPAPASFTLLTPRIGCVTSVTWKLICMSSRPTFSWTFTVMSQLRSVCNAVLCRSMRFDREVWAVLWSAHRPVCASIDHDVDCRSVGCATCIVAVVWLID